jgi:hypothetical protein
MVGCLEQEEEEDALVLVTNGVDRLKERVMDLRKAHLEKPWPPNDRHVGVILVAHSMG